MQYNTFIPSIGLSEYILCYWDLKTTQKDTPKKNTIIPDGTMKMVFHCADSYKHYFPDGRSEILPQAFVVGQLTEPFIVEPLGDTDTFMVRFQSDGFQAFSDFDISKLENSVLSVEGLFGRKGKKLAQNILQTTSIQERILLVENFFSEILLLGTNRDFFLRKSLEAIISAGGNISVEDILQKNKISRRQLERKFSSKVGLKAKQLSKIIRIQNTLKYLLNNSQERDFSKIAAQYNYYDQSHFIKDFKEFTGITPKEFYGDNLQMSLVFEKKT